MEDEGGDNGAVDDSPAGGRHTERDATWDSRTVRKHRRRRCGSHHHHCTDDHQAHVNDARIAGMALLPWLRHAMTEQSLSSARVSRDSCADVYFATPSLASRSYPRRHESGEVRARAEEVNAFEPFCALRFPQCGMHALYALKESRGSGSTMRVGWLVRVRGGVHASSS